MSLLHVVVAKVLIASALSFAAELAFRARFRPQVGFALWAAVLVVLCLPPLVPIPVLTPDAAARPVSGKEEPVDVVVPGAEPTAAVALPGKASSQRSGAPPSPAYFALWFWRSGLVSLWGMGALLMIAATIRRRRRLARLVNAAEEAPRALRRTAERIAAELGVGRGPMPQIRMATGRFSPFLWHRPWGASTIVLPREFLHALKPENLDAILRHELVHYRRRDGWRRLLDDIAVGLWWWLPLSWFARRRLAEFEELCTDHEVVRSAPERRHAYARTLLACDAFLARDGLATKGVPGFFGRHALQRRVSDSLRASRRPFDTGMVFSLLAIVVLPCGVLVPMPEPATGISESAVSTEPTSGFRIANGGATCRHLADSPLPLSQLLRRMNAGCRNGCEHCSRRREVFLTRVREKGIYEASFDKLAALEEEFGDAQAAANTHAVFAEAYLLAIGEGACAQRQFARSSTLHHRLLVMRLAARGGCADCRADIDALFREFGVRETRAEFIRRANALHLGRGEELVLHDRMMGALDRWQSLRASARD